MTKMELKMSFFGTVYYATSLSHCHCSDNYRYASKEIRESIDGFIGGGRDKKSNDSTTRLFSVAMNEQFSRITEGF